MPGINYPLHRKKGPTGCRRNPKSTVFRTNTVLYIVQCTVQQRNAVSESFRLNVIGDEQSTTQIQQLSSHYMQEKCSLFCVAITLALLYSSVYRPVSGDITIETYLNGHIMMLGEKVNTRVLNKRQQYPEEAKRQFFYPSAIERRSTTRFNVLQKQTYDRPAMV